MRDELSEPEGSPASRLEADEADTDMLALKDGVLDMPPLVQQKIALAADALERLQPYCEQRYDALAAARALRSVSLLGRMQRYAARHAPLSLSLDLDSLTETRGQLRGCLEWLLAHCGQVSLAVVPPTPPGLDLDLLELQLLARLLSQHGPEAAQPLTQLNVHAPDLGCRFDAGVLEPFVGLERLAVRFFSETDLRRLPRGVRAVEVKLAGSHCAHAHIRRAKVAMASELQARSAQYLKAWLQTSAGLAPPFAERVGAVTIAALDELVPVLQPVHPSRVSLQVGLGPQATQVAADRALTAARLVEEAVALLRSGLPAPPALKRAERGGDGEGPWHAVSAEGLEPEEAARLAAAWEEVAAACSRDAFALLRGPFQKLANRFAAGVVAAAAQHSTLKLPPFQLEELEMLAPNHRLLADAAALLPAAASLSVKAHSLTLLLARGAGGPQRVASTPSSEQEDDEHAAALLHAADAQMKRAASEVRLECRELALQLADEPSVPEAPAVGEGASAGGAGLALCAHTAIPPRAVIFEVDSFLDALDRVKHLHMGVEAEVRAFPEAASPARAQPQALQAGQAALRRAVVLAEHAAAQRESAEAAAQTAQEWQHMLGLMQAAAADAQAFAQQMADAAAAAREQAAAPVGQQDAPLAGSHTADSEAAVLEAAAEQARAAAAEAEARAWEAAQRAGQKQASAERAAENAQQAAAEAHAAADALLEVAALPEEDAAPVPPAQQAACAAQAQHGAAASQPLEGPRWEVCLRRRPSLAAITSAGRQRLQAPAVVPCWPPVTAAPP